MLIRVIFVLRNDSIVLLEPFIKRHERDTMQALEKSLSLLNDTPPDLITNHNFLLADTIAGNQSRESFMPEFSAVIIDEAHKLPSAVRSMYTISCGEEELSQLVKQIPLNKRTKLETQLSEQISALVNSWNTLFRNVRKTSPDENKSDVTKYPVKLTEGLKARGRILCESLRILPELCQKSDNSVILEHMGQIRKASANLLKRLAEFLSGGVIRWYEKGDTGISLYALPKDLPCKLYAGLWHRHIPYLLTSGTLSANGSFSGIEAALGFNMPPQSRILETVRKSPYPYQENTLAYFPRGISNESAGVGRTAEEIANLIRVSCGHTLVLFTSHRMMKQVYEIVRQKNPGYPLYLMGRKSLGSLAQYKQSENGVLFASDTCGEGIDIPGDTLSSLVIVRLPFAVPDPITDYESRRYPTLREYLEAVTVPDMLIKLRQYAGRLIRSELDTGVVTILDSRAGMDGRYHGQVMAALHDTTVTESIYDVWAFLRNRKEPAFFQQPFNHESTK